MASFPESGATDPADAGGADLQLVPERLAVRADGHEVIVTQTQYRLLAVLLGEPGRAFRRAELVERAMGRRVTERTVDVHVKEIRRKLGSAGASIEAVRGIGYRYRGVSRTETRQS